MWAVARGLGAGVASVAAALGAGWAILASAPPQAPCDSDLACLPDLGPLIHAMLVGLALADNGSRSHGRSQGVRGMSGENG
jgi:hypothetical protein